MEGRRLPRDPATVREAVAIQEQVRGRVIRRRAIGRVRTVAGVDCAHVRGGVDGLAGVVVYRYPELTEVERVCAEGPVRFPYVPGLLTFRELPLILAAVERLSAMPDVFLVDGQGIAHPRRCGIASHFGVTIDRPTIGCAKSILIGKAGPLAEAAGSVTPLRDQRDTIGALLRTRDRVAPLVVSIGHRVDLRTALEIVERCCDGFRLPKPVREADRLLRGRVHILN